MEFDSDNSHTYKNWRQNYKIILENFLQKERE